MSIVSSTYSADATAQADGSVDVVETHVDSAGASHTVRYRAPSGANYSAIAAARADAIEEWLAEREAGEVING